MKRTWSTAVLSLFSAAALASVTLAQEDVAGLWVGELPYSGRVELMPFELEVSPSEAALTARFSFMGTEVPLEGSYDAESGRLTLTGSNELLSIEMDLRTEDAGLVGSMQRKRGDLWQFAATRPSEGDTPESLVVDLDVERPVTVSLDGFDPALAAAVTSAIEREMDAQRIVGLSAAVVLDGEIIDVRSFGWEDHHARIPASDRTMYRWASISKPLTAVAALQLADEGLLDLDRDVREYVPEFPEKEYVMTSRQLLCHQAGVVHYQDMRLRTIKEYEVEHPWADSIIALDMFNESPLLFEPETAYSYTTPGYVLLGAVIERAGEGTYDEQVRARICEPLGMDSMQPDRPWVEIAHRSKGYHREGAEVIDSGDDNICWKIAAGGWISNVRDLARFGAGLTGPDLLEVDTQLAMWEEQSTKSGESTGYGLGIGVGTFRDVKVISHSGGQLKTATYLLVCPDYGIAVALMCNTQGSGLRDLAQEIMGLVLDHNEG